MNHESKGAGGHANSSNNALASWRSSRVKALGEPVIDWCQEVMGFLAFALLLPEASQAGGGS